MSPSIYLMWVEFWWGAVIYFSLSLSLSLCWPGEHNTLPPLILTRPAGRWLAGRWGWSLSYWSTCTSRYSIDIVFSPNLINHQQLPTARKPLPGNGWKFRGSSHVCSRVFCVTFSLAKSVFFYIKFNSLDFYLHQISVSINYFLLDAEESWG